MFTKWWNTRFGKETHKQKPEKAEPPPGLFQITPQRSISWKSLSSKLKHLRQKILSFFHLDNFSYFILCLLTLVLAMIQIVFIHNIIEVEFIIQTKKSQTIKSVCTVLEDIYMFEDLFYLPFALVFLFLLYFFLKSRRFNKYIMAKFKPYFKTSMFREIQKENKEKFLKKQQEKAEKLLDKPCGTCRYWNYKALTQKLCSCFCCLFCCSCCVPPGSDSKCFFWYCCCLGWRQTDFYKVLKAVQSFFYYLFLCPLWCWLWRLTKQRREDSKKKKRTR